MFGNGLPPHLSNVEMCVGVRGVCVQNWQSDPHTNFTSWLEVRKWAGFEPLSSWILFTTISVASGVNKQMPCRRETVTTQVIRIHRLGNTNVCAKFHDNPSNSRCYWDISLKTKSINLMVAQEQKSVIKIHIGTMNVYTNAMIIHPTVGPKLVQLNIFKHKEACNLNNMEVMTMRFCEFFYPTTTAKSINSLYTWHILTRCYSALRSAPRTCEPMIHRRSVGPCCSAVTQCTWWSLEQRFDHLLYGPAWAHGL